MQNGSIRQRRESRYKPGQHEVILDITMAAQLRNVMAGLEKLMGLEKVGANSEAGFV